MSVMERRLQLLLDQRRYDQVAAEAQRSGRSVAAVIREAIDLRFDSGRGRRADAAAQLLTLARASRDEEPFDVAEFKASLAEELDARAPDA